MKHALNSLSIDPHRDREDDQFRTLANRLSELAAQEGSEIVPYRGSRLPLYSALPVEEKRYVLSLLETLLDISTRTFAQKLKVMSAKSSVWGFVQRARLTMPSNTIENISELFLVDIYDLSHKLLFANLRFFEVVSYSIEELYCRPWTELFDRETSSVQEKLWNLSLEMAGGKHREMVRTDYIGTNITVEIASPKPRRFLVEPQFFAPLFRNGQLQAYVCVNSAMVLPN